MTVFDYRQYKDFLVDHANKNRGARAAWADAIGCQRGYITSVLSGDAQLSLEQGERLCRHLKMDDAETDYFLLLIQLSRAGTETLHQYFQSKIADTLRSRRELRNRYKDTDALSNEQKSIFYSSWHYPAIHLCVSIGMTTREEIANRLGIPISKVSEGLKFLESSGFLYFDADGKMHPRFLQTFLPGDSPLVIKHHVNWRVRALQSLELNSRNDVHYSSVFSVAQSDYDEIKSLILDSIDRFKKTVAKTSDENKVACLTVDLFDLLSE